MYGAFIGSLNVYASSYGNLGTAVWKQYGNQGNSWRMAQVTVQTATPFQVCINLCLFYIACLLLLACICIMPKTFRYMPME